MDQGRVQHPLWEHKRTNIVDDDLHDPNSSNLTLMVRQ